MKTNFWTSTEYGGFMQALMRELGLLGINAAQKFNLSETAYRASHSQFDRFILRIRQYIFYPIQIVFNLSIDLLKGRSREPIVVSTNTFFVPLIATYFNRKVIHLVYDLFPEAMIHAGKWTDGQIKVKFFRWIVHLALKRCAMNVFLGQRLKYYVESIHGNLNNSLIIPVGADSSPFKEFPEIMNPKIKILYCGNFGNMHDSDTLFEYLKQNPPEGIEFVFHCSGPKRKLLETFRDSQRLTSSRSKSLGDGLKVADGLTHKDWVNAMQSAQVALVTMTEGSEEVVMPSKTYSAMMAGQAVLAIAPEASDLVDLVKQTKCGWWVKPGDIDGLRDSINEIRQDSETLAIRRKNAFKLAHSSFGQDKLAKKWLKLFESL